MKILSALGKRFLKSPVLGTGVRNRFIAGEDTFTALARVRQLANAGYGTMLHYMGKEKLIDKKSAWQVLERNDFLLSLNDFSKKTKFDLSVKLSSFGLFDQNLGMEKEFERFVERTRQSNTFLWVDAEELCFRNKTWEIVGQCGSDNIGICVQAYAKDASQFLARKLKAKPPAVRICKGAYLRTETEIIRNIASVKKNFIEMFLTALANAPRVQVATHDQNLILTVLEILDKLPYREAKKKVEFAFVLGKHDFPLGRWLGKTGFRRVVYVPYGPKENQIDYLLRRLEENWRYIFLIF